jgi:hypothetical protein
VSGEPQACFPNGAPIGEKAMFLLVQRTDTMPELRAMVNTDHVVAVTPTSGGAKCRLYLANGETWEVSLPFTQALNVFRETPPAA